MLAFPHRGTVTTGFMMSALAAVTAPASRIGAVTDLGTGPFLAQARTEITCRFLAEPDLDWLWMCDTDMTFTTRTLPALLEHADPQAVPLLGASCRTLSAGRQVIATAYKAGKEPGTGQYGLTSLAGDDLPDDTLLRVDATGAACLLAHRSVFARIDAHTGTPALWFAEQVIDGRIFGEDISFCLRAADAGIPVHVHTGIQVGHVRDMQLGDTTP